MMQNILLLLNVVIIGAMLILLIVRTLRWQPTGRKAFRRPIILAVIGIALTAAEPGSLSTVTPIGWGIIALQLATGVAIGAALGMLTQLRPGAEGWQSRGGAIGVTLWLGLIALRFGESALGRYLTGGQFPQLTGLILVMLALSRLLAAVVTHRRIGDARQTPEYA
ncbi:hypothetical protein CGZ98_12965 [Enemella evansiae]|nr:hypothetical protein CGZ98_12965 [Enemella evansiae]